MIKLRTECSHRARRFQAGSSVRSTRAANSTGETNAANAANPVHAGIAKDATRAIIAATCNRTLRRRGTGYHMARPPGALPGGDPLPFHPQHAATPP
ncbi:hypothetical protein [Burkholderia stagnalis]